MGRAALAGMAIGGAVGVMGALDFPAVVEAVVRVAVEDFFGVFAFAAGAFARPANGHGVYSSITTTHE